MNKAMRKDLGTVIDTIITEDTETGINAFHNYIRAKSQVILLGEKADEDEDEDDDSDDKDEDDSDDKDDKKPAFLKKGKKDKKDKKDEDDD